MNYTKVLTAMNDYKKYFDIKLKYNVSIKPLVFTDSIYHEIGLLITSIAWDFLTFKLT